jgi:hypothetical protein
MPILIIDRVLQTLVPPEVTLGRCHGDMAEQELDLFQFASRRVHNRA